MAEDIAEHAERQLCVLTAIQDPAIRDLIIDPGQPFLLVYGEGRVLLMGGKIVRQIAQGGREGRRIDRQITERAKLFGLEGVAETQPEIVVLGIARGLFEQPAVLARLSSLSGLSSISVSIFARPKMRSTSPP